MSMKPEVKNFILGYAMWVAACIAGVISQHVPISWDIVITLILSVIFWHLFDKIEK